MSTRMKPCPVKDCQRTRRPGQVMCPQHWSYVPQVLRAEVYASYRNYQIDPSLRGSHLKLCVAAIEAAREVQ